MPTLEVLVGMIGSGKSTYARSRARYGAKVVSHDKLTEMLHAEYRYEQDLRDYYRGLEEVIVLSSLCHGFDVIVDRTHLTRESRARWVKFVREFGSAREDLTDAEPLKIVAVEFEIEHADVHALRRFADDGRGRSYADWFKVAGHHAAQAALEPLDWKAEGFDACEPWTHA